MPPPIRPLTSPSGLAAPEFSRMEPPPPVRPPGPPTAPTSAAAALKRKRQGSHLVQSGAAGAAPPSVAPAPVPRAPPKRKKTALTGPANARAKPPRKKAIASRGRAPPPPPADRGIHIDGEAAGHAYDVFNETAGSQNVPYTYTEMLAESVVNLSAPLCDFNASYVEVGAEVYDENEDGDDVQKILEADYDARLGRTGNYMETKDVCLVKAWESISLDSITGKDQTYGNYWQRIEDKFHQMMPFPSGRSLKGLQGRWNTINKACSRWFGCLEQVRNAPPSGVTIDDYDRIANEYYNQIPASNVR
ncbi:hypothetical protein ACQJBY_033526 [Aegilops geniculata]